MSVSFSFLLLRKYHFSPSEHHPIRNQNLWQEIVSGIVYKITTVISLVETLPYKVFFSLNSYNLCQGIQNDSSMDYYSLLVILLVTIIRFYAINICTIKLATWINFFLFYTEVAMFISLVKSKRSYYKWITKR